jgi:hypothetical protein
MASLSGCLVALERLVAPPSPHHCRSCGLRHVKPLSLDLVRSVLRVAGGSALESGRRTPLCLCECCSLASGDRWFGRLSRGLAREPT